MSEPPMRSSRSLHDYILAIIVALIVICTAVGGFLIGRNVTRDGFIEKVNTQSQSVTRTTLLESGTIPLNLYQAIGASIDDPLTGPALAMMYKVPLGNREALIKRLSEVAWLPPYRPAPFVGHIARPLSGDNPHINALGFRSKREDLEHKRDRTVHVFITGGSSAWGTGASSDDQTIAALLEQKLSAEFSLRTGYQYEVINTAFPAWSTTQEKVLIQQRLVDLHPDVVLMFSGNNDVHWARLGRDIRWFYSYMDQNYITLLNEMYKSAGHPEWAVAIPFGKQPVECAKVAEIAARNVEEAASAIERVNAQLFFVLQPNIISTTKHLTQYEQRILRGEDKLYWSSCYQALRGALTQVKAKNYRFLDLSRSFGTVGDGTELFIDAYHFADMGNNLVAHDIAERLDWATVAPSSSGPAANDPH
jgi:lysophospholipase L1-like esterase